MNASNRNPNGRPPQRRQPLSRGDPDASQGQPVLSWRHGLMALAALSMLASGADRAAAEDGATLAALEIAHARELNARSHYLAFAAGAEREGHCGVACLFRVAASAESIHAGRLGAAIEQLGGRLGWRLESVVVRTTADNLRTSIARELGERDRLLPRFADHAREECLYEALATINYVKTAEGTHAAMFAAALEQVERRKGPPMIAQASVRGEAPLIPEQCAATHYLCTGDGSIFATPLGRSCPNCGARGSRALVLDCPVPGRWALADDGDRRITAR